jgi:polycomb protein EED
MNTLFCLKDFHPSDIERFASCGMDNTVKIWSMKG